MFQLNISAKFFLKLNLKDSFEINFKLKSSENIYEKFCVVIVDAEIFYEVSFDVQLN